jgi:regulator of sigma E protease
MDGMITTVRKRLGEVITITYQRDGQLLSGNATPRINPPEGQGALGVSLGNPVEKSWIKAIPYGALITLDQGRQLILLPGRLINGQISPEQARPIGLVGMGRFFAETVARDQEIRQSPETQSKPAINTLALVALVSAALGWTNLLPIPALDGGRIIFLLPEILYRKRLNPEHENLVHLIGFASLIILMVYITIQDIINPVFLP